MSQLWFLLLLCKLAIVGVICSSASNAEHKLAPIVQLPAGKVVGITQTVDGNGTVYLYQGIRYGKIWFKK